MRRPVAPLLLLVPFALALAGCGPAGGAWLVALVALALAIAGCSESHTIRRDGEVVQPDAGDGSDAGPGTWGRCCEGDTLSSCFCPAGWACNYGMGLIVCDDGITCGYGSEWDPAERARICGEVPDAGVDAGGDWEPCCDDATGTIESCFCPAGVECNYGLFRTCADGRCTSVGACPEDDAGPVVLDAGSA